MKILGWCLVVPPLAVLLAGGLTVLVCMVVNEPHFILAGLLLIAMLVGGAEILERAYE